MTQVSGLPWGQRLQGGHGHRAGLTPPPHPEEEKKENSRRSKQQQEMEQWVARKFSRSVRDVPHEVSHTHQPTLGSLGDSASRKIFNLWNV